MVFRYWKEGGKATVIENVDRLVFNSLVGLSYRYLDGGRYQWHNVKFGYDYFQFTLEKD